ncbi:cobyrinate a,c-diamide synthase [Simplicispira psychrophila]|uniref:cobyrinate a,c-diamide synthase n=1 Tax=Simplicispira psychrophila TaxID=80882 RepID=UPI000485A264|nr:cobyrinate a,c-diamide synthase [Simplicispira psychrophila]
MTSARCPAVLISAPASGQGKTTVVAALARLLTRQGLRVRVFKCGPDFLDPHWHQLASGAPVHQLDLWMTGEADARARLHAAAQECDVILVEGVMGLFDGTPSAADLALRLDLPVMAVIDASAMAGTFGALAYGLQRYQSGLRWAGVLANRVATPRHAQMLQSGLREPEQWLGALMRVSVNDAKADLLPERHLGLVSAQELPDGLERLDAAADALAHTPLGQMTLADWQVRWSVDFAAPDATAVPAPPLLQGRTVAVARDVAFSFIYAANIDCLRQLGAQVVFFSPLADTALPPCDALWLPGGYPELHAEQLAANASLRASLQYHVAAGKPVWAECGGMLALCDSITLTNGHCQPLWGLLPGAATQQRRLAGLGPQQLAWDGHLLRGHTFHYSTLVSDAPEVARTARPDEVAVPDVGEALYRHGSIQASYFHAWFASSPMAVAALFGAETP